MIQADRIIETTCPFCGVGCQMDLHIKGGQIFRVSGRFDNEVNYGNLCVKGRFGYDFVHAPDRLTEPMIRESRKEAFKSAGWDEALATVAARLQEIRDQDGPDSVAILTSAKCTNEENYLLQKFARAVIGTNNVDHCARL
jgi:predicted molibdopterin-dependent oxidoreductase YjgC